jgi:pSer/pThr/pTyr-binding forkhead associated (FHA) protein
MSVTSIGRAPESSVRVNDESVSRKHAEIVIDPGGFLLRDLGSGNGTYVNGERISEQHIINGDAVQIGSVPFIFRDV